MNSVGKYFFKEELVYFAMFGEELSGSRHADNIALCLLVELPLVKIFRTNGYYSAFTRFVLFRRCILQVE